MSEIKELFDLYDSARGEVAQLEQFLIILGKRRAALEQQRQDIDAMLAEIAAFEKQCRRMLEEKAGANRPVREPT